MFVMVILILIVLGLSLGSFANAFVWRLYKQAELEEAHGLTGAIKKIKHKLSQEDLSISKGRSMCTHCHHQLSAKDLVPVFSYLSLGGKCRYCHKKIEDTPLPELLTPLLFVVSYLFWPLPLAGQGLFLFVLWLVFLVGFVILAVYDLRWFLLPDKVVFPLIGLAALQILVLATVYGGGLAVAVNAILGGAVGSGIFYLLYRYSKGAWIGGGDVKLGIVLGLLAGSPVQAFLIIFLASLLGSLVAVPLLLSHKADRTTHLPFGPFLLLATVIAVLSGERIITWYSNLIVV